MKTLKERFIDLLGEFYERDEYPEYTKTYENIYLIKNRDPFVSGKTYIEIFDELSKERFYLSNLDENMNLNIELDKVLDEYKKEFDIKEKMPSLYRIIEKLQLQNKLDSSLKSKSVKSKTTKI